MLPFAPSRAQDVFFFPNPGLGELGSLCVSHDDSGACWKLPGSVLLALLHRCMRVVSTIGNPAGVRHHAAAHCLLPNLYPQARLTFCPCTVPPEHLAPPAPCPPLHQGTPPTGTWTTCPLRASRARW